MEYLGNGKTEVDDMFNAVADVVVAASEYAQQSKFT